MSTALIRADTPQSCSYPLVLTRLGGTCWRPNPHYYYYYHYYYFYYCIYYILNYYNKEGPDFDDMSPFFPCEIDDTIQYIILGYGAKAPKIVIL